VEYDGTFYNSMSSPVYGYLGSSVANEPVYVGRLLSDCGLVSGSPHTLDVYDYVSGSFVPTGTTQSVTILSGQLALTTNTPSPLVSGIQTYCIMVIPKTNISPSTINITLIGACPGTYFEIGISCPTALQSFSSSVGLEGRDCSASIDQNYYTSVPLADINDSTKYLYAYVFSDINGESPLASAWYTIYIASVKYAIFVDDYGIITSITAC
jgi:hypothetical protein